MKKPRKTIQYIVAVLANAYWFFPWRSPIYQGWSKRICFPGLNCYSCPAATMSCPLGGLQSFLAGLRPSLQAGQIHLGAYVVGTLGVVGSLVGRLPCGWLCPFGLLQELLFRIPVGKHPLWKPFRWGPYVFLGAFVILLPIIVVDEMGYGATWFCRYICPAGTLEAGIPLLLLDPSLQRGLGWLFVLKLSVLSVLLAWCTVTSRPFCRVFCPLGAIYGILNRVSWLQLRFDPDRCVRCNACLTVCPTDVSFYTGAEDINSGSCIRCLRCYSGCPAGAVSLEFGPRHPVESDVHESARGTQP
jgi:ferredoxin-type protein NapH